MKKLSLVLAAVGAGVAAMFAFGGKANAQSGVPTGWVPPSGAVFNQLKPGPSNATGLTLNSWHWPDSGNTGGTTLLVTNAANPQTDFAAFFVSAAGARSPLQVGTTANSGLIAQAVVAGLVK